MSEVKRYRFKGAAGEYVYANDFDRVTAENQALQQRLTTADQRIDELLERARGLIIQAHASMGFTENHPDCIRDLAALNPTTENPR